MFTYLLAKSLVKEIVTVNVNVNADGHSADGVWKIGDAVDSVGFAYGYADHACFHFTNVNVPQGATISSAILTGSWSSSAGSGTTYARAYLNDVDTATFPSDYATFNGLAQTTAYYEFIIPGAIGPSTIANLKTAVQEVVNRGGWLPGNNMQVMLRYTSGGTTKSGVTAGSTELEISYID